MVRTRLLDESEALRRGVQEVCFEAVDDLEDKFDAGLFGYVRGLGDRRDAVLSPFVGGHLRVFAMRRIEDAAEPDAANVANRLDGVGEQRLSSADHLWILTG